MCIAALLAVAAASALLAAPASGDHVSTGASRAAGQATYASSGCVHCHGEGWSGTENGPDLRAVGKTHSRDDIRRQIVEGGRGMPPFAEALSDEQITGLVDFLEAQKKAPKAKPAGRKAAR